MMIILNVKPLYDGSNNNQPNICYDEYVSLLCARMAILMILIV